MGQPGCHRELNARALEKAALAISLPQIDEGSLKGKCHKIFSVGFFLQIASPGPLRGTLGQF